MIVATVILAIILMIAMLRFRLILEYSDTGLEATAKAGPFTIRGMQNRRERLKTKRKELKAGGAAGFFDILKTAKTALSRLRRRLLIKRLTLYYTAGGDDPVKTAMHYGAAHAVFGMIIPVLEESFRIKRRDLDAFADFEAAGPKIYANAVFSIAIWEAVYIFFALFPVFLPSKKNLTGKDVKNNGKSPDKRVNGDNDAEGEGDDRRQYNRR